LLSIKINKNFIIYLEKNLTKKTKSKKMFLENNNLYFKQSIWKQTAEGDWKLFFNTNNVLPKQEEENEVQTKFLFDSHLALKKQLKMGSLVMTPKGIGRLIKLNEKIATIKFMKNDSEENFDDNKISSEFNIFLKILDKEFSSWYRITVPANGTVEQLKKIIEEIEIFDTSVSNYILIYNGQELKEEFFFDQLDLKPNSKMLICGLKMIQSKIQRFNLTYNWWYTYNIDGVTFSVSKKIRLCGVGLYGSHENKIQNGILKLFSGTTSAMGSVLYDDSVEVPAAADQNNSISSIYLKKPVVIYPNTDYTIELICSNYCYLYYGSGGKNNIVSENGIEFTFKYTPGSSHGTGVETGNFPEFYFYA